MSKGASREQTRRTFCLFGLRCAIRAPAEPKSNGKEDMIEEEDRAEYIVNIVSTLSQK